MNICSCPPSQTKPSLNIIPGVRLTIPFPQWIFCIHPPNPSNPALNTGSGFRLSIACIQWIFIPVCLIGPIHHWILYLVLGLPFPSLIEYYVSIHLINPNPALNIGSGFRLSTDEYLDWLDWVDWHYQRKLNIFSPYQLLSYKCRKLLFCLFWQGIP